MCLIFFEKIYNEDKFNLENMTTLQPTNTFKRVINIVKFKSKTIKTKKVWDVLKSLWFDKIWTWKSDLSLKHDNILYK